MNTKAYMKLTLVTVNGRTVLAELPAEKSDNPLEHGKVRVSFEWLTSKITSGPIGWNSHSSNPGKQ